MVGHLSSFPILLTRRGPYEVESNNSGCRKKLTHHVYLGTWRSWTQSPCSTLRWRKSDIAADFMRSERTQKRVPRMEQKIISPPKKRPTHKESCVRAAWIWTGWGVGICGLSCGSSDHGSWARRASFSQNKLGGGGELVYNETLTLLCSCFLHLYMRVMSSSVEIDLLLPPSPPQKKRACYFRWCCLFFVFSRVQRTNYQNKKKAILDLFWATGDIYGVLRTSVYFLALAASKKTKNWRQLWRHDEMAQKIAWHICQNFVSNQFGHYGDTNTHVGEQAECCSEPYVPATSNALWRENAESNTQRSSGCAVMTAWQDGTHSLFMKCTSVGSFRPLFVPNRPPFRRADFCV